MTICYKCGEEITFRYIDGQCTPIHSSGCCGFWEISKAKERCLDVQLVVREFTYENYINPNAQCPVCREEVFFYQSANGGRVFFDELGPPWPKHPCTDNTFTRKKLSSIKKFNDAIYKWQIEGWKPFICERIEQTSEIVKIFGKIEIEHIELYIMEKVEDFGEYPMLIKIVNNENGIYNISTFRFEGKENQLKPVYFIAKLPAKPKDKQVSSQKTNIMSNATKRKKRKKRKQASSIRVWRENE